MLNLRTTLASVPNAIKAIRPPDDDTLKKVTKVWTKYSKRFQLLSLSHRDESITNVVSIGIGHASVGKKVQFECRHSLTFVIIMIIVAVASTCISFEEHLFSFNCLNYLLLLLLFKIIL